MNFFGGVGFETNNIWLNFWTDPVLKRGIGSHDCLLKFWDPLSNFVMGETRNFKFGIHYRMMLASTIPRMIIYLQRGPVSRGNP